MRSAINRTNQRWRRLLFGLAISRISWCGNGSGRAFSTTAPSSFHDWKLEKYTLNVRSGTGLAVQALVGEVLCEAKTKCPSDLGCGSLRSWCIIGSPYASNEFGNSSSEDASFDFELHWVDSSSLNDFMATPKNGTANATRMTDAWVEYFDALNGDLSTFNAFMHNKIQLYATDLAPLIRRIKSRGLATMARLSIDTEGFTVLHVGFAIAGRIYEIVGAYDGAAAAEVKGGRGTGGGEGGGGGGGGGGDIVAFWNATTECAVAHSLHGSLASYRALAFSDSYRRFKGRPALMVVGISMTYHDPSPTTSSSRSSSNASKSSTDITTLFSHLSAFTGATVAAEATASPETCASTALTWDQMPGLAVRYVHNRHADDELFAGIDGGSESDSSSGRSARSVRSYDAYAAALHATFASPAALEKYGGKWYNWDHSMDQHVGLWYSGNLSSCSDRAAAIRSALEGAGLAVGERSEPDAHEMYVGYAGPMTWEYQFQHCDAGRPEAPSECACVPTNNDQDYHYHLLPPTGMASESRCPAAVDDDWCGGAAWS